MDRLDFMLELSKVQLVLLDACTKLGAIERKLQQKPVDDRLFKLSNFDIAQLEDGFTITVLGNDTAIRLQLVLLDACTKLGAIERKLQQKPVDDRLFKLSNFDIAQLEDGFTITVLGNDTAIRLQLVLLDACTKLGAIERKLQQKPVDDRLFKLSNFDIAQLEDGFTITVLGNDTAIRLQLVLLDACTKLGAIERKLQQKPVDDRLFKLSNFDIAQLEDGFTITVLGNDTAIRLQLKEAK